MAATGGSALADRIVSYGIRTVFSLAGAGHTHLLMPLEDRGVRIIGTRHETSAVAAADGYARITGDVGIAMIIAEQGLPNAITAIATAFHYGSPVVVLITRFPDSWIEAASDFVVDHHALLSPITKWSRTVPSPAQLPAYFDTACRKAREGRPGPVVLIMPQDFLAAPAAALREANPPHRVLRACAAPGAVKAAADLIAASERPAILIDSGCDGEKAKDGLSRLHHDFGIPVFSSGGARGLLPEDDIDVLPWAFAQPALKQADLLLVAGAQLNMWFGFGRAPRFPDTLKVIQIDAQADSIGRNRPVTLGIVGDPGLALGDIAEAFASVETRPWRQDWLHQALQGRRTAIAELLSSIKGNDPIHPVYLAAEIERNRQSSGFYIGDGADILNWSYAAIRISRAQGYMDHQPLGSMGVGLPLAIGAAAAERDIAAMMGRDMVPTTLLTGDGALGFYIAELDTVSREKLPLKIIVGNDGLWGTEFHGQMLMTGRTVNTRLGSSDYAKVAEGFKLDAAVVTKNAEVPGALKAAFSTNLPMLLDVKTDPSAGARRKTDPNLAFVVFSDLAPPDA